MEGLKGGQELRSRLIVCMSASYCLVLRVPPPDGVDERVPRALLEPGYEGERVCVSFFFTLPLVGALPSLL